jgi:hypothetical protein
MAPPSLDSDDAEIETLKSVCPPKSCCGFLLPEKVAVAAGSLKKQKFSVHSID